MLHEWIRTIVQDDTVTTDYSLANSDDTQTIPAAIVAADDAIYIGKQFPFNNFFVWIGTANENSSSISVQYWNNNDWQNAVDILDGTSTSGVTLAKSGVVQFSPMVNKTWTQTSDTSSTNNSPTELQSFTIYNLFWLKITFNNDLSAGTTIKKLFYRLTDRATVNAIDTDLSKYEAALSITDLTEKIILASKEILTILKVSQVVFDDGQILRFSDFYLPTAYQVLVILLQDLGEDFKPKRELYIKKVSDFLKVENLSLDTNANAFLEEQEFNFNQSRLVRT